MDFASFDPARIAALEIGLKAALAQIAGINSEKSGASPQAVLNNLKSTLLQEIDRSVLSGSVDDEEPEIFSKRILEYLETLFNIKLVKNSDIVL